jgi:glucosylceramidase
MKQLPNGRLGEGVVRCRACWASPAFWRSRFTARLIRHWAKSVILWNLALNQNHEPYLGGCTTCRGEIVVDESSSPAQVKTTVDYTALGHASKFVQPGARRIESNTFGQGSLEDVAFQNPDGSIVLLAVNSSDGPTEFNVGWRRRFVQYKLGGGEAVSLVWAGVVGK